MFEKVHRVLCLLFYALQIASSFKNIANTVDLDKCRTCVTVSSCPRLQKLARMEPISMQSLEFYETLSCGFQELVPMFCCDDSLIEAVLSRKKHAGRVDSGANLKSDIELTRRSRLKRNQDDCDSRSSRIIGGYTAANEAFPFVASLGYIAWSEGGNPEPVYRCGGSLVSSRHVITAAHCLRSLPAFYSLSVVRIGNKRNDNSNLFKPKSRLSHPDYERTKLGNDIGIVTLDREVRFSDLIQPVCLPFETNSVSMRQLQYEPLVVAGWGITEQTMGSNFPHSLQYITINYLEPDECGQMLEGRYTLTDTQICTKPVLGKDSCAGDSGGPLFLPSNAQRSAVLVGLVSFGAKKCGSPDIPGVYTDVRNYRDFVLDNLK